MTDCPHYLGEIVPPTAYRRSYSRWYCECGRRSINFTWEPVEGAPDGTARCVQIICKGCGAEPFGSFTAKTEMAPLNMSTTYDEAHRTAERLHRIKYRAQEAAQSADTVASFTNYVPDQRAAFLPPKIDTYHDAFGRLVESILEEPALTRAILAAHGVAPMT